MRRLRVAYRDGRREASFEVPDGWVLPAEWGTWLVWPRGRGWFALPLEGVAALGVYEEDEVEAGGGDVRPCRDCGELLAPHTSHCGTCLPWMPAVDRVCDNRGGQMSDKVMLRATVEVVYWADPADYGNSDPARMAAIDEGNWRDDVAMFAASFDDGEYRVTVEPA